MSRVAIPKSIVRPSRVATWDDRGDEDNGGDAGITMVV